MTQLFAGVARADITPPVGIAHPNWGAQLHERAAGIDLPMWVTALALRSGDETVVIVDIDIIYLYPELAAKVRGAVSRLTGLPLSHIRISYTHTHSGPATTISRGGWTNEGMEMVPGYSDSLPPKIAGAAWEAIANLQPVRIAAGIGHSEIAVNRRFHRPEDGAVVVGHNWEGAVDHDVTVLRIDALDGSPIAAVVGYACHPITVGPDNDLITPDYPGIVKRVVEQNTGATTLFLQGATGNVGPIRGCARNGVVEYKVLGQRLGLAAATAWSEIDPIPRAYTYIGTLESGAPLGIFVDEPLEEPDRTLRVGNRNVELPHREYETPERLQAAYEANVRKLQELRDANGDPEEIRRVTMECKRTSMRARLAEQVNESPTVEWELQAITIGDDIALICSPGEPFVEIGLAIKDASPYSTTFFGGYSNVGGAYMPWSDAYPKGGYEIEVTPFAPEAAQILTDAAIDLLKEISAR
ncbi:MAG: neutral/alkaline non-lysosomal ceramidase N-terminal domain-containing protein [Thermomicrobiales bacterium]|nr:neutral/alkaline non-lysosomal ceramidase N-terminal domain-containing protein [Thermomicrobiales bacterium]